MLHRLVTHTGQFRQPRDDQWDVGDRIVEDDVMAKQSALAEQLTVVGCDHNYHIIALSANVFNEATDALISIFNGRIVQCAKYSPLSIRKLETVCDIFVRIFVHIFGKINGFIWIYTYVSEIPITIGTWRVVWAVRFVVMNVHKKWLVTWRSPSETFGHVCDEICFRVFLFVSRKTTAVPTCSEAVFQQTPKVWPLTETIFECWSNELIEVLVQPRDFTSVRIP
jgi:hypothetical protein